MPKIPEGLFLKRRFISTGELSKEEIERTLLVGKAMKEISEREIKKTPTLRGKTVINCFLEPSTRTRTSFEIAGKRLSADVINISGSGSSLSKGESLRDMMGNLKAMRPDLLVIRSKEAGAPEQISRWIDCPVVNAGDGRHEHPTQSMLDLMTISENKETFDGLKVSIIGDIANSRVARSNLMAFKTLGAVTTVCGPPTLLPMNIEKMANKVTWNIDEAVHDADVVMTLRIQKERMDDTRFPSLREYSTRFGLNMARLKKAKEDVIVMHPGPINQGVEISPEVAESPASVILDQVTNGVAIRMAIMYLLTGAGAGAGVAAE